MVQEPYAMPIQEKKRRITFLSLKPLRQTIAANHFVTHTAARRRCGISFYYTAPITDFFEGLKTRYIVSPGSSEASFASVTEAWV